MRLFTFDTICSFAFPSLARVREGDSLWNMEATRRRELLLASRNEQSSEWQLASAEFGHTVGEYMLAVEHAKQAIALAPAGEEERIRARSACIRCMCHLSVAQGEEAAEDADRLAALADVSNDPLVKALAALVVGMNRDKNVFLSKLGPPEDEKPNTLRLFQEAAQTFVQLGEIDLALRAYVEFALVKTSLGKYMTAMETIETAAKLAKQHDCWGMIGRLQLVASMAATDQGYRRGVEKTLRESIAWSDYLGDVWGRNEGWIALARMLAYDMPIGDPNLAAVPDEYLLRAVEEAEALGLTWMIAGIDNTRAWVYRKAGDESRSRRLLGEDVEEKGLRETLAAESTVAAERIMEDIKRKTSSRLHDGVEDSLDAFFVFDALRDEDGQCRDYVSPYANRAAHKLVGRDPSCVCLYSEAQHIPQLRGLELLLFKAVEERVTSYDVLKVGRSHWVQRRVVPSGDGAVLTLRDVSAEKQIEAALRKAAESAERSERAKSAFLANMSHEIRTPLNGVLGLARMLAETDLDGMQRSYVDDIVLSGDILLDLIGDVLDLSKIESQEMRLAPSPISLANLVYAIVKLFRGQAEERLTNLSFSIASDVPETVLTDGVRLRQVLANLVGNAVKFTQDGEVEVKVFMEEPFVVFEIRDTGMGIPPDRLEAIFDRFQQAGLGNYGGTGLGLTISKALTELMGGHMRVVSELDRGSSFFVCLPLPEVAESTPAQVQDRSHYFEGRRILLVDDNRVNTLVSAHALRKLGCEVVCAEDGRKALSLLESDPFDLVFMDVRMPLLDGLEATRILRRREAGGRRTPVIALTAGALVQEQQECFDAGMDDFASKPITTDAIRDVLAKWIGIGTVVG